MKLLVRAFLVLVIIFLICNFAVAGSQQVSSTSTSAIYSQVRSYLNATSTSGVTDVIWPDSDFLVWLNDGIIDIVSKTHCLQATENITLVANQVEYSITSNYIKLVGVQLGTENDSGTTTYEGLTIGNVWSVGNVENVAEPVYYYEFAGKVGAYPAMETLSGTTVNEHIKLFLVSRPTDVTAGGNITVPAIYDRSLVFYIAAQAMLKDRQVARYNAFMSLYNNELDRYRQDFIEPALNTDEVIKQ